MSQPEQLSPAGPAELPKRVPGQQPVTSGFAPTTPSPSGAAGLRPDHAATKPKATADAGQTGPAADAGAASAGEAAAGRAAGSAESTTLNPAPTASADDEESDELPAFRRTRSSPTPPQGEEDPG